MILAVCVDDKLGMLFNKRRQSKDSELRKDLLSLTDKTVWVNEYTAKQFTEDEQNRLNIQEDYLDVIGTDDICFAENLPLADYEKKVSKLILYRWNRIYPSDVYFPFDLANWEPESEYEFTGSSHDKITRCIYVPKETRSSFLTFIKKMF